MPDLTTTYLGISLKNPLIVSASPLSKSVSMVQRLEASAIVMYSLFEEQITHESLKLDHYLDFVSQSYSEAMSYFPDLDHYNVGPTAYLDHLARLKRSVNIPIIGSLNGVSSGGWVSYARQIQEAGADALELNIYYLPTNPDLSGEELEEQYVRLVTDVREQISIPLAIKLSPFFSALPHMAKRIAAAGADGLVLFNRFYQPDLNLETLSIVPNLDLSTSHDLRLPLRWIAILYGRVSADLALTGGVHTEADVLKAMMAGARVTMIASALVHHGPEYLTSILAELEVWMTLNGYTSIQQMQGSMSQQHVANPAAFERANYMKALNSLKMA